MKNQYFKSHGLKTIIYLSLITIFLLNSIIVFAQQTQSEEFKFYLPAYLNVSTILDKQPNSYSLVLNPYANVNWSTFNKYKANLHTHTKNSDGDFHPHVVIDAYHAANYHILALTDHNEITYPWTNLNAINSNYENRDPQALGMLDIEGNELSKSHHRGSLINAVSGGGNDLDKAFTKMTDINGLGMFNHPGRYWSISTNYNPGEKYSLEWYQYYYETYPVNVGMEVYNKGDRYPDDRVLWDELLVRMMPNRPIWGYSNDDMHSAIQYFRNYNYMLMPELTLDAFTTSMLKGASFFAYEDPADGNPLTPFIDSITIDKQMHTITVHAKDYTSIEWISGVSGTGAGRTSKVVGSDSLFSYNLFLEPYVRAVLINSSGRLYTQPFGFADQKPSLIDSILGETTFCQGTIEASFSVKKDSIAENYNWVIPANASFVSGEGSHHVIIDISNLLGQDSIRIYTSNLSGNSDTAFIAITVNPVYDVMIIDTICKGETYTLGSQTLTESGLFVETFASQNLCDSVVTIDLLVIEIDTMIYLNDNILTASMENANYQWLDCNNEYSEIIGETGQSISVNNNGSYAVRISYNNCIKTSSCMNIVGVDYNNFKDDIIKIYPNPSSSVLFVVSYKIQKIVMYDVVGQVVFNGILEEGINSIFLNHIPSGIYFIKVNSTQIMFVKE